MAHDGYSAAARPGGTSSGPAWRAGALPSVRRLTAAGRMGYPSAWLAGMAALIAAAQAAAPAGRDTTPVPTYDLVRDGQGRGCIIVAPGAVAGPMLAAAQDLAAYVHAMSGASLPVRREGEGTVGFPVFVENTRRDRAELRRQFLDGYYGAAAADAIERVYVAIEAGARASVTGRGSPSDRGSGLHEWESGYELLAPALAACRPDLEAALAAAERLPAEFRRCVVRDVQALLGSARRSSD